MNKKTSELLQNLHDLHMKVEKLEKDVQHERRSRSKQHFSGTDSIDKQDISHFGGSRDFNDQDSKAKQPNGENGAIIQAEDVFQEDEDGNRIKTVQ